MSERLPVFILHLSTFYRGELDIDVKKYIDKIDSLIFTTDDWQRTIEKEIEKEIISKHGNNVKLYAAAIPADPNDVLWWLRSRHFDLTYTRYLKAREMRTKIEQSRVKSKKRREKIRTYIRNKRYNIAMIFIIIALLTVCIIILLLYESISIIEWKK